MYHDHKAEAGPYAFEGLEKMLIRQIVGLRRPEQWMNVDGNKSCLTFVPLVIGNRLSHRRRVIYVPCPRYEDQRSMEAEGSTGYPL